MIRIFLVFLLPAIVGLLCTGCLLFKPSVEKMTERALAKNPSYDAIIVPGIQFREPAWDRVLQMRLIWAKHLYDRGLAKHIITSGSSVYTPYVEGQIMAEYLAAMGVPREKILVEDRAEHSTENLWYGWKLAKQKGFRTVALASDPFQSKMLWGFAKRRTKGQVQFLPTILDTLRQLPHDTPTIKYQDFKVHNFVPITEKHSKFRRLMGTLGKNINFREKE